MSSALLRSSIARTAVRTPRFAPCRTFITLKDEIYIAKATSQGAGRNGQVASEGAPDAPPLSLKMATPKAMGGRGDGHNPEQLFAMGYASCFLGALQLAASRAGQKAVGDRAKIHASVVLGHPSDRDGFGLKVHLSVEGVEDESLLVAAHDMCPYSRALAHGVEVSVSKA
ncbi:OsmC-domain-containing protein [Artomyces pyxidatus]|uniref:OsmC-domain-containing protein n=1 Tax=Artomyces pyxidatus TaxID=48021 RepID=A0ACB8TBX3_9AGAM|nr:OsmC-domain-containing protein [Artomyces pyxidatus]